MLRIFLCLSLVTAALSAPQAVPRAAPACDASQCSLPDCKCSSTSPPDGIDPVPQFVFLTFDDAVTTLNYPKYVELFSNKTNPDGCSVGATFFLSHEYTDYSLVHALYVANHEIALHSISHVADTDHWKNISMDELNQEFGDEKKLIAHFGNIPDEAMVGMRVPFLQLSGDQTFQVGKDIGLKYDCSWPTQTFRDPGMWPYTLDYKSHQDCPLGLCPKDSIPGMWVIPMIDWKDQQGVVCSMTDACVNIPNTKDELLGWYKDNFNVQYNGTKAPFGFYIHAAWFSTNVEHYNAYKEFVVYLNSLPDVYIVSISQGLKWLQNPVNIGSPDWPACTQNEDLLGCNSPPTSCELKKGDELRYMTVCGECPDVYPWLGNPYGEAQK